MHCLTHAQDKDSVHRGQQVDVPAPEDTLESRPAKTGASRATDLCHSLLRNHNLILREPPRSSVLRQIGDRINSRNSDRNRDHAVHNEQPLPATKPVSAFKPFVYRSLQITAEHASRSTCCKLDNISVIRVSAWVATSLTKMQLRFPNSLGRYHEPKIIIAAG
jgi:hypothetical protein